MKRNIENLVLLNCIFVICLVVANVISSKLVILGNYFVVPAAVVSYGITFLCTDIIGEIWGKEEANKAVKRGLLTQIIATCLILFAIKIPIAPFMSDFQEKLDRKGTRLNSSHANISYAVFCLKKKKKRKL